MKAAFLTGIEQVEIREAPEPKLESSGDVKLRIESVGVCGSDMHYYRTGQIGEEVVEYPWTVGHECAARVAEIGDKVENVKIGDRVAVDPLMCCGKCDQCLAGREHTCRDQKFLGCPRQAAGTLAEYVIMPARCCYCVPDAMTSEQTAVVEPFSIGLYAQRLGGDVASKKVAILGSGPMGLSVLLALKQAGAGKVYMTDIRDYRAELARDMGADWISNPASQDIVAGILQDEPLGVDLAYECAGEQDTVDQCVELLKPGGVMILVGIQEIDRVSFEMNAMRRKELRLQNVRRQNLCVPPAIELIASGKVNVDAMVTHHFSLSETPQAFDMVSNYRDNVVKAIIHVSDE